MKYIVRAIKGNPSSVMWAIIIAATAITIGSSLLTGGWEELTMYLNRPITELRVGEAVWLLALLLYIFGPRNKK